MSCISVLCLYIYIYILTPNHPLRFFTLFTIWLRLRLSLGGWSFVESIVRLNLCYSISNHPLNSCTWYIMKKNTVHKQILIHYIHHLIFNIPVYTTKRVCLKIGYPQIQLIVTSFPIKWPLDLGIHWYTILRHTQTWLILQIGVKPRPVHWPLLKRGTGFRLSANSQLHDLARRCTWRSSQ